MNIFDNRIIAIFTMFFFCIFEKIKRILLYNNKDIWLIGEHRGFCLKDNGFFFYKFCRQKYPDQSVYFAVRRNSPYFNKLTKNDKNIVAFGSTMHIRLFFKATLFFYTHSYSDIIYRRHFEIFRTKAKLIYLHHGVLGFKKFNEQYMKDKNLMDLFIVGNTLEQSILINDIGINDNKVKLTGYSRFDHLIDSSEKYRPQIVYIPTHRNWIKNEQHFIQFYKNIDLLINNKELHHLLKTNNAILKIYLHYNMQKFTNILGFNSNRIQIIRYGEESPLELISKSNIMITDYSSVSWDFFYLGKPIIFYRFDVDKYNKDRGSYISLEKNIIGDVAFNHNDTIMYLSDIINNNYSTKKKYLAFRDQIFPFSDHNHCFKIYDETKKIIHIA